MHTAAFLEYLAREKQDIIAHCKPLMMSRDLERALAEAAPNIAANHLETNLIQLALPKELWGA